ncbi:MAG: HypC/HybG/HupF family hydrogenase formation chaperone [Thermoflexales bacterium]|nr:HypC/HybG/HupF family hydrogenase formation chaperone [Thermoflexales bacterium]
MEIYTADGVRMGKVDFGGVIKDVCLEYLPELTVGEYAIVHVGFAITRVDEASAQEMLRLFQALGELEDALGAEPAAEAAPPACPIDPWAGAGKLT